MKDTEETPHAAAGLIHTIVNALVTLGLPMQWLELPIDALTDERETRGESVLVITEPTDEIVEDFL